MDFKDGSDERSKVPDLSAWNYRVVKKNGYLAIHEAYYDDHGNVRSLSVGPVSPAYEELTELKTTLELMLEAVDQGILDFEEIDQIHECSLN